MFEIGRTYVFFEGPLEHFGNIPALRVASSETLGPADELAVVDAFLPGNRKQVDLACIERLHHADLRARVRELDMTWLEGWR